MQQSKRCSDQDMTYIDNRWSYTAEPADDIRYLQTSRVSTINCMLEEIKLTQISEFDAITTPLGVTNMSMGSLSHNHLTLIWDPTYTTKLEFAPRLLEKGTGVFYNSSTPGTYRLDDESQQLGFHIRYEPRCHTPRTKCEQKIQSYAVVGEPHLFVVVESINGSKSKPYGHLPIFIKPSKVPEKTYPPLSTRS